MNLPDRRALQTVNDRIEKHFTQKPSTVTSKVHGLDRGLAKTTTEFSFQFPAESDSSGTLPQFNSWLKKRIDELQAAGYASRGVRRRHYDQVIPSAEIALARLRDVRG
jgi:hypothetical protein